MSGSSERIFVDTNILVYAFEKGSSSRNRTARFILDDAIGENRLCLSTQVLQELFVTLTRKVALPSTVEEALDCLESLACWPIFSVDYDAIRQAALLSKSVHISFWDSLIIEAAARSGAETLYTEDLNHDQTIRGVRILNPFR